MKSFVSLKSFVIDQTGESTSSTAWMSSSLSKKNDVQKEDLLTAWMDQLCWYGRTYPTFATKNSGKILISNLDTGTSLYGEPQTHAAVTKRRKEEELFYHLPLMVLFLWSTWKSEWRLFVKQPELLLTWIPFIWERGVWFVSVFGTECSDIFSAKDGGVWLYAFTVIAMDGCITMLLPKVTLGRSQGFDMNLNGCGCFLNGRFTCRVGVWGKCLW